MTTVITWSEHKILARGISIKFIVVLNTNYHKLSSKQTMPDWWSGKVLSILLCTVLKIRVLFVNAHC